MDYKAAFTSALEQVRSEGRYRVFADLKRHRGEFPRATWTRDDGAESDVVVWCSNDYLGQGQNPVVTEAMQAAIDEAGAGSGGTRNISGTTHYHVRAGARAGRPARQGSRAAVHLRLCLQRGLAVDAVQDPARADHLLRRAEPQLDDRGIRAGRGERTMFRHNDLAHLEELLAAADPADAPKLIAFESVYSMDGDIADMRGHRGAGQEVRRA